MAEEPGWTVERDDPKKPFPLKIVEADGTVIARVYGYSGKTDAEKKHLAFSRAKAIAMIPATLRALAALGASGDESGVTHREKYVQAHVRARGFAKHAGNLRAEDVVVSSPSSKEKSKS